MATGEQAPQPAPRNAAFQAHISAANAPAGTPQVDNAPVTNDDRISNFAQGFLNDLDQNQDPDQREDYDDEPLEEQADAQVEDEGIQDEGAETPTQETELVEVEYEGQKYNLPPKIREGLLQKADYTRKTQELAASRKNVEAISQSVQQAAHLAQQLAPLNAQLFSMQGQAQQMRQMLTRELADSDPIQFNMIQGQLGLLQQDIQDFHGQFQQAKDQYQAQMQQIRQQSMVDGLPELRKAIPDIDKPEVRNAIGKYAMDVGLPAEALQYIQYSPVAVKMLWQAQQYEKLIAKQAESKKSLQEKTKGLPAVKTTARGAPTQEKQLRQQWHKNGGSINDPAFDAMLKARLNRRG